MDFFAGKEAEVTPFFVSGSEDSWGREDRKTTDRLQLLNFFFIASRQVGELGQGQSLVVMDMEVGFIL